jgi:predicted metal-binding membrane protein
VRIVAFRSLWRRRHRAIVGFLIGYMTTWVVVGMLTLGALEAVRCRHWNGDVFSVASAFVAFAVAAGWQLTPVKQRALRRCHRTIPIAPRGWRANLDCIRYGIVTGRDCIVSCWALMVASLLAPHHVLAMVAVSVLCAVERYRAGPQDRITALALVGCALVVATAAAVRIGLAL